jgi:segregation and condensation protein B
MSAAEHFPALKALMEAALFQKREPVPVNRLARALAVTPETVAQLIESLISEYDHSGSGLQIRAVAGGYLMSARPDCLTTLQSRGEFLSPKLPLSQAALETLALIAYRQPVTAAEVMATRGVHTAGVLKTLLDRKLIQTAGRRKAPGHPILYKTTRKFLVEFGLEDLDQLPALEDFRPVAER